MSWKSTNGSRQFSPICRNYQHEHIFIDNASKDNTLAILKDIARRDPQVKVIANARNFGHLRSPMHAMFQACGDAVILLFSDLQDPPELLRQMIEQWENGIPVVLAIKETSDESGLMFWLRTKYYQLVSRLADLETYREFYGIRALRPARDRYRAVIQRPLSLFSRHDRGDRPAPRQSHLRPEAAAARDHEEQFLYLVRLGNAGDHQSSQRCRCVC